MLEFIKRLFSARGTTPTQKPASKPAPKEPYVFVTLHGKKFHYDPNCPGLKNAKIYKMDLSKAKASGRKACDKCCYRYLHDEL